MDDFVTGRYFEEYMGCAKAERDETFLGRFFHGAIAHKGMVIEEIQRSKNKLAGSVRQGLLQRFGA